MLRASALAASVALTCLACSPAYIPNTDVEDNSENRRVIKFCEDYRHAVEDKNIGSLLNMASPKYREDGGNINGDDDIDYDGLRDYLSGLFVKTQSIRYEIRYRRITRTESAHVLIDYTYAASYRLAGLKGDEWRHTVADNRLDIVPEGEGFKIIAGM